MSELLSIGAVAKRLGINPKTIRYYENLGLISPFRGQNGYRVFTPGDEHKLVFVKRAKMLGFTLNEIGEILQDVQSGACETTKSQLQDLIRLKIQEIDYQLKELKFLKSFLIERVTKIETSKVTNFEIQGCSCLGENL